jgi:hypothetical protein
MDTNEIVGIIPKIKRIIKHLTKSIKFLLLNKIKYARIALNNKNNMPIITLVSI